MTDAYSFLGPFGTFTEAALRQVEAARGKPWRPVNNVGAALADVVEGRSRAAMIAIENSVEGGVTATQDALFAIPGLRIEGEYLVNVNFALVGPEGAAPGSGADATTTPEGLASAETAAAGAVRVHAHPVAYGQCRAWLDRHLPAHVHVPAASNASAGAEARAASEPGLAIIPPHLVEAELRERGMMLIAEGIADRSDAQTRFVLVSRTTELPAPTGADKTSLIVELAEERSGALLEMLEQFATRGVNLSLIQSRPLGERFSRYFFVLDADGHVRDARVRDALIALKRVSPRVIFLGSYPRADGRVVRPEASTTNAAYDDAEQWVTRLLGDEA